MELASSNKCFGGTQNVYNHQSKVLGVPSMTFAVFLPPQAANGPVPALLYLSGLTCTHENVMTKGQYQQACAEAGIAFIAPDTSPRGEGVPNDDAYDLGQGAGFYVNATEAPWAQHFRMESYIIEELLPLCRQELPILSDAIGITGHSMGGHGALTLALKNPGLFKSLSAFAPICAPSQVPWGEKIFGAYLGDEDRGLWAQHDATALINSGAKFDGDILVDVGAADGFLTDQLKPELLAAACRSAGQALSVREHAGYDHSYYFIASFMAEHVWFHADRLGA